MKKIIFILLIINTFKGFSQNKNAFTYQKNDVKIELKTANEKNVLKKNGRNAITIRVENLDPRTMSCIGPGLRLLKGATDTEPVSLWELNLPADGAKNLYKFRFSYIKNNEHFSGEFEIPIE